MERYQEFGLAALDFHRKYRSVWPLFAYIKNTRRSKTLLNLTADKIKYPYADRFLYGDMGAEVDLLIKK